MSLRRILFGGGLLLLSFLLFPFAGHGKNATSTVIRVAHLIDGTGGAVRSDQVVVVTGGKIVQVVPYSKWDRSQKIDHHFPSSTLLPGLIDLHVHLNGSGGTMRTADEFAPNAFERHLRSALAGGVTSVRSLCDDTKKIMALRREIRRGKYPHLPRLFAVGPAFTAPGGHPTQFFRSNPSLLKQSTRQVDSPEEARKALDRLVKRYRPDQIKIVYGGGYKPGGYVYPRMKRSVLKALIDRSHEKNLTVTVHVDTAADARNALEAGADGLEHVPFRLDDKLIDLMAKKQVYFTPTLAVHYGYSIWRDQEQRKYLADPRRQNSIPRSAVFSIRHYGRGYVSLPVKGHFKALLLQGQKNLARAVKKGVKVVTGSDAGNPGVFHGAGLITEIELMVDGGLTPLQAIHGATGRAGACLGKKETLGVIARGAAADLIVVKGRPHEKIGDLYRLEKVMVRGKWANWRKGGFGADYQKPAAVKPAKLEVEDTEDGDLVSRLGTGWAVLTDRFLGGKSTGKISATSGGRGKYSLHFQGKLDQGRSPYAFSFVQCELNRPSWQLIDGSAYKGVEFYMKGTAPQVYLVLGCTNVQDYRHFSGRAVPGTDWKRVLIPFAKLRQVGWGEKATFDPKKLYFLRFLVLGSSGSSYDLWIDDVRFYR